MPKLWPLTCDTCDRTAGATSDKKAVALHKCKGTGNVKQFRYRGER